MPCQTVVSWPRITALRVLSGFLLFSYTPCPRISSPCRSWNGPLRSMTLDSKADYRVYPSIVQIGELAKLADVSVQTVRFYERLKLLPEPQRKNSGRQTLSADAICVLIERTFEPEKIRLTL